MLSISKPDVTAKPMVDVKPVVLIFWKECVAEACRRTREDGRPRKCPLMAASPRKRMCRSHSVTNPDDPANRV